MDDDYKEEETPVLNKEYLEKKVSINIYDPKISQKEELSEEDLNFIQSEFGSCVMCEVPETAFKGLERLYDYFINAHFAISKFLKDDQIRRLVEWIPDDLVGFLAIQCLNFIVNDKKQISFICVKNKIFEKLKYVIENHLDEDEQLIVVFDLLSSLIQRSPENRNIAESEKLFDDLDMFYQRSKQYLPHFVTFIVNSLSLQKYPPSFYIHFINIILNMFMDEEYVEYALQCVNYIAENDANCLQFFNEPTICQALLESSQSEFPNIRIKSTEYIAKAFGLDESVRDILYSQNVVERMIESLQTIRDDSDSAQQLNQIMEFIISYCNNSNETMFPAICALVDALDLEVFLQEFPFETKREILLALRTYVQYANGDMIIQTLGGDACQFVASLLDENDPIAAYNIIVFVHCVSQKVPEIDEFQGFRDTVTGDFYSTLNELVDDDDQELAQKAQEMCSFIESLSG